MSFAEFTNNKNKGVLWGLLQEGGVFSNIPASMFQNVKHIFEMSIVSMKPEFDSFFDKNDEGDDDYDKKASEMIINSNKLVIKKVIDEVNRIKTHNENSMKQAQASAQATQIRGQLQQQQPNNLKPVALAPTPIQLKKSKIEEIYRADDIKKTRMSELEIRLKEKQAEMDSMLNNKKPEYIDFSDKALGINKESDLYDKKLAGDEMERLLAEALASRERELEKLNIDTSSYNKNGNSGNSGNSGNNDGTDIPVNKIIMKRPRESKNVTFNDADNTKVEYESQDSEHHKIENIHKHDETDNHDNTLSFFSKLKTKKSDINTTSSHSSIPLDDFMNGRSDDENENENENDNHRERMQLHIHDMHNFGGTESRETRETRETMEMQQMREMQKYIILEKKIQEIQSNMNEIKKNQELILSILEKKLQ